MLNAEAYVLFYRKVNDKVEPVRAEMHRLLEEAQTHPSLLQFYVSRQWINKLENFAEPGNKFKNDLNIFVLQLNTAALNDAIILQRTTNRRFCRHLKYLS